MGRAGLALVPLLIAAPAGVAAGSGTDLPGSSHPAAGLAACELLQAAWKRSKQSQPFRKGWKGLSSVWLPFSWGDLGAHLSGNEELSHS